MAYLWASEPYRWTDLLNSDAYDHRGSGARKDRLELDEWLGQFLELCGYEGRLPGAAGRAVLRRMRSDLARLVSAILRSSAPEEKDLAILNRYLRIGATRLQIERKGRRYALKEVPSGRALDRVVGYLARSLAETLANGELERIKVCANPDCHWVMYDESRNRSRRWCETAACGNLVKVRQFRERKAREEHRR